LRLRGLRRLDDRRGRAPRRGRGRRELLNRRHLGHRGLGTRRVAGRRGRPEIALHAELHDPAGLSRRRALADHGGLALHHEALVELSASDHDPERERGPERAEQEDEGDERLPRSQRDFVVRRVVDGMLVHAALLERAAHLREALRAGAAAPASRDQGDAWPGAAAFQFVW
jgi:hypothetical protein